MDERQPNKKWVKNDFSWQGRGSFVKRVFLFVECNDLGQKDWKRKEGLLGFTWSTALAWPCLLRHQSQNPNLYITISLSFHHTPVLPTSLIQQCPDSEICLLFPLLGYWTVNGDTHSFVDPHCGFIVSSLCQVFSTAQHPHPWFTYHGDCSTLLPFISHYSPHSSHPQSLTSEISQRRESGEHSLTFPKPLTAPVRVAIFTSSSLFQGKGILSSLSLPSYSGSSHLPFVEALLCCHLCLVHPLPLLCLSPSPSSTNTLSSSPGLLLSPPVIPFLSSPSLPSCFRNWSVLNTFSLLFLLIRLQSFSVLSPPQMVYFPKSPVTFMYFQRQCNKNIGINCADPWVYKKDETRLCRTEQCLEHSKSLITINCYNSSCYFVLFIIYFTITLPIICKGMDRDSELLYFQ